MARDKKAPKGELDKTVIVVMTDGEEDHSREVTKQGAKAALDCCKAKSWQVVFLGADFDAFGEASQVGVAAGQTLNMTVGNYGATMATTGLRVGLPGNRGPGD
jgi:hypothetical protein